MDTRGLPYNPLIIGLFTLDLIGFLLLGIGLMLYSQKDDTTAMSYRIAGMGMLGWFVSRLSIQILIIVPSKYSDQFNFQDMIYLFSLNSIFLLISGLTRINDNYLNYTTLNFIAVWSITIFSLLALSEWSIFILMFSVFLKVIIVPIHGIIAFREGYYGRWGHLKSLNGSTDTYPEFQ